MRCTCLAPIAPFPFMHATSCPQGRPAPLSGTDRPAVGAAVLVVDLASPGGPMVLLGQRRRWGAGTWAAPGGHVEHAELGREAAARELLEETGIAVSPSSLVRTIYTEFVVEGRHHVTLWFILWTSMQEKHPRTMEPDKCVEWRWLPWGTADVPLGLSTGPLMQRYKSPIDLPVL